MSDDLDKLATIGVPPTHIECLRWIREHEGELITDSTRLMGVKGKKQIPPNKTVTSPHYIHPLSRGSYKPAGDPFVQTIQSVKQLNRQGYSREVAFDAKGQWTEVRYDHKPALARHYYELGALVNCYENKVPVGIIYKLKKGHNLVLGLGIITSVSGRVRGVNHPLNYKFEPYDGKKLPLAEIRARRQIDRQHARRDYSSRGRPQTVIGRTQQGTFTNDLREEYDYECAMCNFPILNTVDEIGSQPYCHGAHIVPKNVMDEWDPKNAMNPKDGLLLCRYCDIAFENGDITVDEKYRVGISSVLEQQSGGNDPLKSWLACVRKKIRVNKKSRFKPAPKYLKKKLELVNESRQRP